MREQTRTREKELRLALVCFGGVSLAIYVHGVSKEILKLVRASRTLHGIADRAIRAAASPEQYIKPDDPEYDTENVYFDLLREIGKHVELRVIVDVISGASAGGINGVMLARALAHDLPVGHLRDMWLESGDVTELLAEARRARRFSKPFMSPFVWALGRSDILGGGAREAEVRRKLSLFVRSRWFKPPLDGPKMSRLMFQALDRMGDPAEAARSLLPTGLTLDLFVTVTDFYGYQRLVQIHDPAVIREREHRHILHFRYRRYPSGDVTSDFLRGDVPGLAFAARATSAYPGVFPPAQLREIDAMLAAEGRSWPRRPEFVRSAFREYHRAGLDPEATSFIDGSVLNNKPFAEAIDALQTRFAYRQVDRRLLYIDPDPAQPPPPPSGRTPGFFATLRGALSDLPRNQPIAEQLEAIEAFNDTVRRRRVIVDAARPEVERLVTELPQASTAGPLDATRLRTWREAAKEQAARNAGFAFQGYVRRRIDSAQRYLARSFCSICGMREGAAEERIVEAIIAAWERQRGIEYRDGLQGAAASGRAAAVPSWMEFLARYDVEFCRRRLVFLIKGQNRLYGTLAGDDSGDVRSEVDKLKRAFYIRLDRLRRFDGPELVQSVTCDELRILFAALPAPGKILSLDAYAEAFAAENEAAITRIAGQLAAEIDLPAATAELDNLIAGIDASKWPERVRREVLVNYVGFPFWDVLTMTVTGWRDFGEFDEIRIDRIGPEDAPTLSRLPEPPQLQGTVFLHFGGFFSRSFRENDYLLGRLHSIDRIIDIVCDSAGAEALASVDVAALKRRAFDIVLRAEEAHLPEARALIARLRAELVDLPRAR